MHPLYLITEKKLDARARACIYLGHKAGIKGFILYDTHTREVFISRNVVFHENVFPFQNTSTTNSNSNSTLVPPCSPFAKANAALTPFDAESFPTPPPHTNHNDSEPDTNPHSHQINPVANSPKLTNTQPTNTQQSTPHKVHQN